MMQVEAGIPAAMNIPILLGVDGEARTLIEDYNAGVYFEPENKIHFIKQLNELITNKNLYKKCQLGGQKLANDFDRSYLAKNMLLIMEEATLQSSPKKSNTLSAPSIK